MQTEVTKKRFTVEEYYKMDEVGILTPEDRTELIAEFTEFCPDAALFKPHADYYGSEHPGPADTLLVLEIADSSSTYDRDLKLKVYAASNVSEVWIADLRGDSLLVFRDPSSRTYKTALSFKREDSISCLAFPDIQFPVQELLA